MAMPHWKWIFANCPTISQNTYIDGAKMISTLIEETKDEQRKQVLIDSLMMVYDQRIQHFGREGYVLGRKSVDALTYKPEFFETVFPWLKKSVELQGSQSEGAVLAYYLNCALQMSNKGLMSKEEVFSLYETVSSIADKNLAEAKDDRGRGMWNTVKANIESIIEPIATCSDLVAIYEKKFMETPEDIALLKNITGILEKRSCTAEGNLFFNATRNLHKLEPSAESAYLMGRLCIQNQQYADAAEYMQQAVNLYDDTASKIKALYALTGIQINNKTFQAARTSANRILQLNENEGKAYMLIGDIYAMTANSCNEDGMGGKTVFWAAIDKYMKAKAVDNTLTEEANSKIAQYHQYYPPASDLFFRDMKEGTSYTIGCWINETTTVRAAN
jgi:tetratricopeptide (TPR) repeat protein